MFIEDTAVVLDEVAVLMPMGHESRRAEPSGVEPELHRYREVQRIELPATIDGGDVLRVGHTLIVGLSSRTNAAAVRVLAAIVRRSGYDVLPVPVHGCLHLKSACTALPDQSLLLNPAWLEADLLKKYEWLPVPEEEPEAANVAAGRRQRPDCGQPPADRRCHPPARLQSTTHRPLGVCQGRGVRDLLELAVELTRFATLRRSGRRTLLRSVAKHKITA